MLETFVSQIALGFKRVRLAAESHATQMKMEVGDCVTPCYPPFPMICAPLFTAIVGASSGLVRDSEQMARIAPS